MGKIRLIARLVGRDLRRRPGPALLLVLAITAATATLTLGLVLHGVTSQPYQQTQAATYGPDVVALISGESGLSAARADAEVRTLSHAPGVIGYSGPFPVASAVLRYRGLTVLTVVLVALAILNAICAAWTTVLDARHSSALARALGATPGQVTAGIAAAQVLPAGPGVLLGIPLGIGLYAVAVNGIGIIVPPAWWLAAAVLGTLAGIAVLAAIPALADARRPVSPILQSETA